MKGRSLLVFFTLVLALGCGDDQPTGPSAPADASEIISDGANGPNERRNKDFFFLPPLVAPPFRNPDFELGKFNKSLRPSLKVVICKLAATTGLPTATTACVTTVQSFGPGTPNPVNLVTLPRRQFGWWSLLGLPDDGFYYVLWNTRQSNLQANRYYRIKIFIEGDDTPLGFADVDPMSNLREWRSASTGQVVQLVNGVLLPIPFRVEKGAFCEGGTQCTSVTLTGTTQDGSKQFVRVDDGNAPIAGVSVESGWLPVGPGRPQSVVFTITRVNTGLNDIPAGTQSNQCHKNMRLQQFDACFNYSTIPELTPIDESGKMFAAQVIAAVCFVLHDRVPADSRYPWVQLWSSEPDHEGDEPKPLISIDGTAILTNHDGEDCETQDVPINPYIGNNNSNAFTRFASTGWRKLKSGMGRALGVKTVYAVDVGLGGILDDLSNIGPALTAEIRASSPTTPVTVGPGTPITSTVRIVGTQFHDGDPLDEAEPPESESKTQGIPGLPVTFTLENGAGTQIPFPGVGGPGPMSIPVPTIGGGLATLVWTAPPTPGTYRLRANGQAKGGTITYTATVAPPPAPDLVVTSGTPVLTPRQITTSGGIVTLSATTVSNLGGSFALAGGVRFGVYLSTDATITPADQLVGSANIPPGSLESGGAFNLPFPVGNVPPGVLPGNYFLGFLIDDNTAVAESNEGNNFVSAPFVVWPQRMISMQTGATIQFSAAPPAVIATWLSSAPTNVQVSATGLITAIVGGENSNGGDGATLTSVLSTGSGGPAWLVNSPFPIFPRITTAVWVPVAGAASYDVATEYGNGCTGYANCGTWAPEGGATGIAGSSSSFTFEFVGTQPGRWRVTARDATGAIMAGSPSPWIFFRYIDAP